MCGNALVRLPWSKPPFIAPVDSAGTRIDCQGRYARHIGAGRKGIDVNSPARLTSIDVIGAALESVSPGAGWQSSPDGAVTLMLSDIADAEAVAAEVGPERWQQLLADHHLLVERLLAHHDGSVVRFEQDGFLATFNSAHGGVYAALELQRTFGAPVAAGSGTTPTALLIGLHSG